MDVEMLYYIMRGSIINKRMADDPLELLPYQSVMELVRQSCLKDHLNRLGMTIVQTGGGSRQIRFMTKNPPMGIVKSMCIGAHRIGTAPQTHWYIT